MNIQKKLMIVRNSLRSGKTSYNSFAKYSYRNAEQMLSGIKPILAEQGLTLDFKDEIAMVGTRYYLKTTLTVHDTEDGEMYSTTSFAREQDQKKGTDEAQITGACITYAHKYALMGMFSISDPNLDPDSMDNRPNGGQESPEQKRTQQGWYGPGDLQDYPEPPEPAPWGGYGQGFQGSPQPAPWGNGNDFPEPPEPVYPKYR